MARPPNIGTEGQILRFPGAQLGGVTSSSEGSSVAPRKPSSTNNCSELQVAEHSPIEVVLCGTFRKDTEGLRRAFEQLRDLGCRILSPGNVEIPSETEGSMMRGEEIGAPKLSELQHLDAIQHSHFIWLHAPRGYVGPTAALEIGFARASGVPIFSSVKPYDIVLQKFVRVVTSPKEVILEILHNQVAPPVPALQTFQHYYRRTALQRGYESESAHSCLLLMMEEIGELACALRRREKQGSHETAIDKQEAIELADVFIQVVRMANILRLDLGRAVQNKEILNSQRTTLEPS